MEVYEGEVWCGCTVVVNNRGAPTKATVFVGGCYDVTMML